MTTRPAVERTPPPDVLMRVVNPVMRALLRRGRGPVAEQLMLLHLTGRRSGRRLEVPIGQQRTPEGLFAITSSGWRANLRGGADVEVTLRGRRIPVRAELIEDPETVARFYERRLGAVGHRNARQLGIRLNVDRAPTHEELLDAVKRSGLSVIRLTER